MGEETKQLRRLVIKAYHIREAMWGEENKVEESGVLTVDKESADRYKRGKEDYISDISFRIIKPEERDQYTNTIMDIIPISAKVLGNIGEGMGQIRAGVTAAHSACDEFVQELREQLKKFHGDRCTERHEYYDVVRPGKKKVLIIKQVAGQGAMYDMHLFAKEPSGVEGGRSIIDMGNMPVLVTPNEYRDGILRSMQ